MQAQEFAAISNTCTRGPTVAWLQSGQSATPTEARGTQLAYSAGVQQMTSFSVQQPGGQFVSVPFGDALGAQQPSGMVVPTIGRCIDLFTLSKHAGPSTLMDANQTGQWLNSMQLSTMQQPQQLISTPYVIQLPAPQPQPVHNENVLTYSVSSDTSGTLLQWPMMTSGNQMPWTSASTKSFTIPLNINNEHPTHPTTQSLLPMGSGMQPTLSTTTTTSTAAPSMAPPLNIVLNSGQQLSGMPLFTVAITGELVPNPASNPPPAPPPMNLEHPSWSPFSSVPTGNMMTASMPSAPPSLPNTTTQRASQPIYLNMISQQPTAGPNLNALNNQVQQMRWITLDSASNHTQLIPSASSPVIVDKARVNTNVINTANNTTAARTMSPANHASLPPSGTQNGSPSAYKRQVLEDTITNDPNSLTNSGSMEITAGVAMKAIRMGHAHANTSSVYLGVTWYKASRRWQARLCCDNKKFHLGYFATEQEAAKAYDRAVLEHKGPYAPRNFPDTYLGPTSNSDVQPRSIAAPTQRVQDTAQQQQPGSHVQRAASDGGSAGSRKRSRDNSGELQTWLTPKLEDPCTPSTGKASSVLALAIINNNSSTPTDTPPHSSNAVSNNVNPWVNNCSPFLLRTSSSTFVAPISHGQPGMVPTDATQGAFIINASRQGSCALLLEHLAAQQQKQLSGNNMIQQEQHMQLMAQQPGSNALLQERINQMMMQSGLVTVGSSSAAACAASPDMDEMMGFPSTDSIGPASISNVDFLPPGST